MLCISLWQPWASLWAAGIKVHETRHWRCDAQLGRQIGIHAAKRLVGARLLEPRVVQILRQRFGDDWERTLPRGAVVGGGRIVACWRTEKRAAQVSADERALGDWRTGHYAWQLAAPVLLPVPLPCTGRQGWFDVPDLVARAAALKEARA